VAGIIVADVGSKLVDGSGNDTIFGAWKGPNRLYGDGGNDELIGPLS
jgi:hypothetical protein